MRAGELVVLAGAIAAILSLLERWYETPIGNLGAWNDFGPAIVLLLAAVCAALAVVVSALAERSPALPVSSAVWCVWLSLLALIAAIVRVLERPDHASMVCVGAWLALAGSALMLIGAWLALRDERPSMYRPARPAPRPRPR